MGRVTAIVSISLPPEMAREIESCCRTEHRTRSELIREALRAYLREAELRSLRAGPAPRDARLPSGRKGR